MKLKFLLNKFLQSLANLKNNDQILNFSLFKGIIFSLLFFGYLGISIIFNFSISVKITIGIIILLLWKIIQGMSWLNFYYLLLSIVSFSLLGLWFKKFFLLIEFIILFILIIGKIIYNKQYLNRYLFYFIWANWILTSYGLYFYANRPFVLSLVYYLIGTSILTFYFFLLENKKTQTNYFVFLLLSSELYWLLNYFSLSGLGFSLSLAFLGHLLLLNM